MAVDPTTLTVDLAGNAAAVRAHGCSMLGRRDDQQDRMVARRLNVHGRRGPALMAAVLDGHRGQRVAEDAAGRLLAGGPTLDRLAADLDDPATLQSRDGIAAVRERLAAYVRSLNRMTCRHVGLEERAVLLEQGPRPPAEGSLEVCRQGSTLTLALVTSRAIALAHLGDSRAALLWPDGHVSFATRDHHPDLPEERGRIEAAGLTVTDAGRIGGAVGINMSRALGDTDLQVPGLARDRQPLSGEPDVAVLLRDHRHSLLLLASDGVWNGMDKGDGDTLTTAAVGRAVARSAAAYGPAGAVHALVEACAAQDGSDNVTALLLDLRADDAGAGAAPPLLVDDRFSDDGGSSDDGEDDDDGGDNNDGGSSGSSDDGGDDDDGGSSGSSD